MFALFLIVYYELLFRFFAGTEREVISLVITLLFSLCYGAVLALLSRPTSDPKKNKIITGILLFIIPVFYLVEYFVFRSFNVFYDLNTVVNGAGGALTEFTADIMRLVLNPNGISCIILYFLPLIIFVLFLHKKISFERRSIPAGSVLFICAVLFFVSGRFLLDQNEQYKMMYSEEYNYQNVVGYMGLGTGLRLDSARMIMGDEYSSETEEFVIMTAEQTEEPALAETAEEPEAKPEAIETAVEDAPQEEVQISYGPNVLNIDFNALADSTDGKLREMDLYVASLTPTMQNEYTGLFKGKNLIFMTAEAFSGYLIDPVLTPTLYRLSTKGIQFPDYYQPAVAGTTGGEYSNLFGLIPTSGGKSMKLITSQNTWITIANRLSEEGYYGKAYHDNSMYVYDRHETHNLLGYSDGFMGIGNGMEEYLKTSGFPASDLEMLQGTLPTYINRQPFDIYYMTVSGHGQYGRSINQMASKNYERVKDLDHSEIVKCYLACNIPLEDALTYLVDELEKAGIADDTVIVLGADHFPYNLDTGASPGNMPNLSELYGFDVTNYLERDSNRLIIWSGCLEDMDPIVVDEPVFSLDILPTLCNLFGVAYDSRLLPGRDVFSDKEALVFTGNYDWKTTLGTYISSKNRFTPVSEDTVIPEDYVNQIRIEVRNRMNYCKNVLGYNYFDHVFGEE
ncbi:MAG: sulfatase-like hydrolase/transferase [Lachnospiraceae bacterium]|nr:sulfatase-like hydrolase/transferase [Lachnospiraceae bacterium]